MIKNIHGEKFFYEDIEYTIGAEVVATGESEYAGLYGRITEIRDGSDRETENDTPDIYCEFDPPVMPDEIRALEETFSNLYGQPKTLDDITLDLVIMAPEMVRQLDDLQALRDKQDVFILMEDWAEDGENGNACELYTDYEDAKRVMQKKIRNELSDGCLERLAGYDDLMVEADGDSYEAYLDGEYMESHYRIAILRQPLTMSSAFVHKAADKCAAQCHIEDFISQIEEWDEAGDLTEDQYQKLIHNPKIHDMIDKQLSRNDNYWESYWESVSEVAHKLVSEAKKDGQPQAHRMPQQGKEKLALA